MTVVATVLSAPIPFGFNLMPGFGPLVIGVTALAILIGGLLGILRAALGSAPVAGHAQVPMRSLTPGRRGVNPSRPAQQPPIAA
jgi:hypothetical protein